MFCKKCGKEISADSVYCKFCGAEQDVDVVEEQPQNNTDQKPEKEEKQSVKRAFANEVVAISRLVGLAIIIWIIYMIGFVLYRSNDIKPSPELPFGESRYDSPYMQGNYILNDAEAERAFSEAKYQEQRYLEWSGASEETSNTQKVESDFAKVKPFQFTTATEEQKAQWKKEQIEKGHNQFNEDINSYRRSGYEGELKDHLWYTILIIICSLLCFRYLYKAVKWVNRNKTN